MIAVTKAIVNKMTIHVCVSAEIYKLRIYIAIFTNNYVHTHPWKQNNPTTKVETENTKNLYIWYSYIIVN